MESLSDSSEGTVRRTRAKFAKAGAGKLVSRALGALRKHPDAKTKPCTHCRKQHLDCDVRSVCAAARTAPWIGFCNSALKHLPPRFTKSSWTPCHHWKVKRELCQKLLKRFSRQYRFPIAFAGSRIHYRSVMIYRVAAKIAVCMLLVILSLGAGTSAGAHGAGTTAILIAQTSSAAPGCHGSPTPHPCGSNIPDCGISCPAQGALIPATGTLLTVQAVASVEYPRLTNAWPGRDVAPTPYPPRVNPIG